MSATAARLRPMPVRFGRDVCGDANPAGAREWLVTNGIGGYASGTVAGFRTRRYHGLLVAALNPPSERTVMATDLFEDVSINGDVSALGAAAWRSGALAPRGFEHLESFELEGRTPVWRFAIGHVLLEKRVRMEPGRNTTVVTYRLLRGSVPVRLTVKVLATYRDYHATTRRGDRRIQVVTREHEVRVMAIDGGRELRVAAEGMTLEPAHEWYEGFELSRERERGLEAADDALLVATAAADVSPGETVALVLTAESDAVDVDRVLRRVAERDDAVLAAYAGCHGDRADGAGMRLALAADQFVVRRDVAGAPGATVIAGYHWFTDWGRDTMIALPGLTLETGRPDLARQVLSTYAKFVDGGMIPNRFPDAGTAPEYNTVDATLWYVEAVRAYVEATGDAALVRELWPALEQIVACHEAGTRFGIVVDPDDGLLYSGEDGVQLTWMDAKVGDWVVTPRSGKCVEVNTLWHAALVTLARLAPLAGQDGGRWLALASRVRTSFQRFWRDDVGYLSDVLDGPAGDDASLRPNQIFAVALPATPLMPGRWGAVVDACATALVTSHGLRSLAPADPRYRPSCVGDQVSRDGAYHQGTVWAWLIAPFALAHHRVHGDAPLALSFLEPVVDQLSAFGVGSIPEIFDGDPPHRPRGCIAQAWSVAEVLRAWTHLRRLGGPQ